MKSYQEILTEAKEILTEAGKRLISAKKWKLAAAETGIEAKGIPHPKPYGAGAINPTSRDGGLHGYIHPDGTAYDANYHTDTAHPFAKSLGIVSADSRPNGYLDVDKIKEKTGAARFTIYSDHISLDSHHPLTPAQQRTIKTAVITKKYTGISHKNPAGEVSAHRTHHNFAKDFQNVLTLGHKLDESAKYDHPASRLTPHPVEAMKDENESGLDWEYKREVTELAPQHIKNAFKSREHFGQEYAKAEVRHLTPLEHHSLDYSTHTSYIPRNGENRLDDVKMDMNHRRDVGRIADGIQSGKTAYPIVIKHYGGMRILAGNTRMSTAASLGKSLPVKILDITNKS